jgi:hypothetical protein
LLPLPNSAAGKSPAVIRRSVSIPVPAFVSLRSDFFANVGTVDTGNSLVLARVADRAPEFAGTLKSNPRQVFVTELRNRNNTALPAGAHPLIS